MAYSESLAQRLRPFLLPRPGASERTMFGGLGFLLYGNVCCGIWKDALIVRLAPEDAKAALTRPHVRVMDITGKPMRGWLLVDPPGLEADSDLYGWVEKSFAFASTLPRK